MKANTRFETVATIVLAFVCAGLFLRLGLRVRAVHAVTERAVASSAMQLAAHRVAAVPSLAATEAFVKPPALDLTAYDKVQSQPVVAPDRDPFSFPPTPAQLQAARAHQQAAQGTPAGPPPPPPVPFKTVGYSVDAKGNMEAYLADDQQVYVVREGQEFDKGYRAIKITPNAIQIQDESFGRLVELAFPQQ